MYGIMPEAFKSWEEKLNNQLLRINLVYIDC